MVAIDHKVEVAQVAFLFEIWIKKDSQLAQGQIFGTEKIRSVFGHARLSVS